jgi:hypothetical protein
MRPSGGRRDAGGDDTSARLAEEALSSNGRVSLAKLVELLLPLPIIRGLAQRFGRSPKGGFRLDRAPASVLAPLLVQPIVPELLDEVCAALVETCRAAEAPAPEPAREPDQGPVVRLLQEKLARAEEDLSRAQEAALRARQTEAEQRRRLQLEVERGTASRAEVADLTRRLEAAARASGSDRDLARDLRELERELELVEQSEEEGRRRAAAQNSRIQELEAQVAELEALVPPKRRRREPPPPLPPLADRFRVPHFTPSFYKSMEGIERRSVEAALHAVLLFATAGPSYPSLEVKQLEGLNVWSMRASINLRVYFRLRDDGDIDVLEMATREGQHTALKRMRERG